MYKIENNHKKTISAVPIDSEFYGEFESDSPMIDLYSKIISADEKTKSKSGSLRATM